MMGRAYDPFSGTDFAQGGMPRGNEEPPAPMGPPAPEVPNIPRPQLTNDASENARRMQEYLSTVNRFLRGTDMSFTDTEGNTYRNPGGQLDPRDKEIVDQIQAETSFWLQQAAKSQTEAEVTKRQREQDAAALERTRLSTGATLGAAGISAGASKFSAEEATRRAQMEEELRAAEGAKERTFKAGESAATRAGNVEVTTLSNKLAGEREAAQRSFDAEQKAMDREIQRIQLDIAQGNLNLNSALGQLEKWLEAQKFTLPEGAEYVPGFQPGGAVQESARLAGVGYSPANYRANTVPFDPQALVRQTMGR